MSCYHEQVENDTRIRALWINHSSEQSKTFYNLIFECQVVHKMNSFGGEKKKVLKEKKSKSTRALWFIGFLCLKKSLKINKKKSTVRVKEILLVLGLWLTEDHDILITETGWNCNSLSSIVLPSSVLIYQAIQILPPDALFYHLLYKEGMENFFKHF